MPAPPFPHSSREPAPFNPRDLGRSVIAIPLREKIKNEAEETKKFMGAHRKAVEGHNAAVFYRVDSKLPLTTMHKAVKERLEEAKEESSRMVQIPRHGTAKPETKPEQIVDRPLPKFKPPVSLAYLEGLTARVLLAIDAAQPTPVIERIWPTRFEVIIDINLNFKPPEGTTAPDDPDSLDARRVAKEWIAKYIDEAKTEAIVQEADQGIDERKTRLSAQYVFARLEGLVIEALVRIDQREALALARKEATAAEERIKATLGDTQGTGPAFDLEQEASKLVGRFRTIHHIWPDFKIRTCITHSISTVKVDAAHRSFTALGKGITWAVADTGIHVKHPHFRLHKNVNPASPYHADFTGLGKPLEDGYGHGTHVAGIIAGAQVTGRDSKPEEMTAVWRELDQSDPNQPKGHFQSRALEEISGMAPKCELVSLKVLDRFGQGLASNLITAIAHVQAINHNGRELHIHGLNLSLGYPFDPKWFACGHSPLCVEVNRLVKSGVVVVVAAGNTGYGTLLTREGESDACLDLTINDPGNAEYAITVGSTHRDMPHMYGISYFSSKGPTGDGRYKPDLLAPGEKIISCAAPKSRLAEDETESRACAYFETSGTSMAAPHVSGAIAAFLSIRREFIGEPEKVKKIFTSTATDLGRDRYFQGAGVVDLMRAIQSV